MSRTVVFENRDALALILGANDSNVPYLENLLDAVITAKGDTIELRSSDEEKAELFSSLMKRLGKLAKTVPSISESEIFLEYQAVVDSMQDVLPLKQACETAENDDASPYIINLGTRSVCPKNRTQKEYLKALDNSQLTFATGPAGTGKTFLAVAWCLQQIITGKKQKLILSRPVVEAGESLGFLPGDLSQKLNPYLKPLYDSMEYVISPQMVKRLEESNMIEISPLAYMRGRSLHHCCVILDEAQNTTAEQMKMFLTRLGEDSVAIVTGDLTQTDLPGNKISGLRQAVDILNGVEGISFVNFHSRDVVRSRLVQRIVNAYEKNGKA